jgi:hypothetical protein
LKLFKECGLDEAGVRLGKECDSAATSCQFKNNYHLPARNVVAVDVFGTGIVH